MATPILSITVPTYNRVKILSGNLPIVLRQLDPRVELLVSDNCSPDATWQYLESLPPAVRRVRQERNLGAERNMLDCIARSQGDYIWLLGDDDTVADNVVANVLQAVDDFHRPALIYLRTQGRADCPFPGADKAFWIEETAEQFVGDISHWVTFCSSIIVRRDCLDLDLLRQHIDTCLLAAALTLSVAFKHGRVVVSTRPLVSAQAGEPGAYDAVGIFSRNFRRLLNTCAASGWSDARTMKRLYQSNLQHVVAYYLQSNWPLKFRSALDMILWSLDCRVLYTRLLPLLWRRIRRGLKARKPPRDSAA
jgi:glycosyltransferase involved in cell wall biosynthesis